MGQVGQAGSELPVTQRLSIPSEPTTLRTVFISVSSQTDVPTIQHHHLHLQPRSSGANFPNTLGAVIVSVVVFAVLVLILWRCCAYNDGDSERTSSSRSRSPGLPRGPLKPPRGHLPVMAEHPASFPPSQQGTFPPPPPEIHIPEGGSQEEAFSLESDEGTEFDPKPHRRPLIKSNTFKFLAGQQSLLGVPRIQERWQQGHKS